MTGRRADGIGGPVAQAKSKSKRGDIQGLRAIAVGLVVLAHSHTPFFTGGFVGVDVFFVLSGFLITGLLIHESERTGRISITGFYARRARRILPAATVVLVAITAFTAMFEPLTRLKVVADDALWSAVFLANFHFADIGSDYFANQDPSLMQHYWSLAVEEQFYLVWPLLLIVLVFLRASRRVIFGVLATIWLGSLLWSIWSTGNAPVDAYFSSLTRAFELATGALLAVLTPLLTRLGKRSRVVLSVAGMSLVLVASFTFTKQTPFPGWLALVPVLGTAALLAAGTGTEVGLSKLLGLQPLRHLGDLSFSIYLWHWPVLLIGASWVTEGWQGTLLLLLITLLLSELSFFCIEQPFQHGKLPVVRGKWSLVLWPVSLAMVISTVVISQEYGEAVLASSREKASRYYEDHPDSLPPPNPGDVTQTLEQSLSLADDGAPLPPGLTNLDRLRRDVWQRPFPCYASFDDPTSDVCPSGDPDAETTVVVYGDSHAGMWLPAFAALGKEQGFRVMALIKVGCAPYDVVQSNKGESMPTCPEFRDWARAQIQEIRPDAIVMAARGMWSLDVGEDESREEAWSEGVAATVQDLSTLSLQVTVLGDIPTLPWDPLDCATEVDASMESCTSRAAGTEIRSNKLTRDALQGTGASYVPTTDLVCVDDRCPLVAGQLVTYRDSSHLSLSWTKVVAARFGQLVGLELPGRAGASNLR